MRGEIIEYPRKIPKLLDGAVPSIFPNLPKYLSSVINSSRRLPDVEKSNLESAIKDSLTSFKQYTDARCVKTLGDVKKYFSDNKHKIREEWVLIEYKMKVILCFMSDSNVPHILGSITIDNDMKIILCLKDKLVSKSLYPNNITVLKNVNDIDVLIYFIQGIINNINCDQRSIDLPNLLKLLQDYFLELTPQLSFILEQIKLLDVPKNNRRYSGNTLIFAASMYVHSSVSYQALYNSNNFQIPHPRNIKKIIGRFSSLDQNIEGSIAYLKTKREYLRDEELLVNLQLDEIYINPQVNFKGDSLYGYSQTDPSKIAKTAQVFMISSILSKYKDVVSIIPVNNLTAEKLKRMISQVLKEVESIGFKVISLVSDNNSVNRKAFELFTPNNLLQPSIPHPIDDKRLLFFIFDTVHIVKSIRNNWINKRSANCTLKFPSIESDTFSPICSAQFRHLELVYETEKKSLVKYAPFIAFL